MRFEKVLPVLRKGKRVKRKDIGWENYYSFLFISETRNKIFSNNAENHDYKFTKEDLLADDWEIVKEKKTVKLRDLTKEQYDKWSKAKCNGRSSRKCASCPFRNVFCATHKEKSWFYHKDLYSDKFLDQEIEIEE